MTSQRKTNMKTSDTLRDTRIYTTHGSGEIPAVGFGTLIPDPLATKQATRAALKRDFDISIVRNATAMKQRSAMRFRKRSRRNASARGPVRHHEAMEHQSSPGAGRACLRCGLPAIAARLYRLLYHPYALCLSARRRAGPEGRARSGHLRFGGYAGSRHQQALERLVDNSHCRSVGLSDIFWRSCTIISATQMMPPMVQVESHPYLPRDEAARFLHEHGIVVQAFAALGHAMEPNMLADPVTPGLLAQHLDTTPAQVALAWAVRRGTAFLTTSTKPSRIQESFVDPP